LPAPPPAGHDSGGERFYKRPKIPAGTKGFTMTALYMIIAFVVAIALLNVLATGRID
jgi:hypothetical protein